MNRSIGLWSRCSKRKVAPIRHRTLPPGFPHKDTQAGDWDNEVVAATRAEVIESTTATQTASRAVRVTGRMGPKGQAFNVGQVVGVPSGQPPYVALEGVVREVSVRLNMLQLALDTSSFPVLQIDKELITAPLGLTTDPPIGERQGATYMNALAPAWLNPVKYIHMPRGQMAVLSGVPDHVLGSQVSRRAPESDASSRCTGQDQRLPPRTGGRTTDRRHLPYASPPNPSSHASNALTPSSSSLARSSSPRTKPEPNVYAVTPDSWHFLKASVVSLQRL